MPFTHKCSEVANVAQDKEVIIAIMEGNQVRFYHMISVLYHHYVSVYYITN